MAPGDKRKEAASAGGRGRGGGAGGGAASGRGPLPSPQGQAPPAGGAERASRIPRSRPGPTRGGVRGRGGWGPRRAAALLLTSPPEAFNVGFLLEDGYVN